MIRIRTVVIVLLAIGLLVALLYPFQHPSTGVHVRVEGRLVSQHSARPLPGVCVVLFQWATAEDADQWCSGLRTGRYHTEYQVPEGEAAIFYRVGMTDAEGRFRLYADARWPISENLLGMRFGPDAPDVKYRGVPFFLLREGAESVQVPVPDGGWRESAPSAEALPREKEGYLVYQVGSGESRRIPYEELADLPVRGVLDLGSIPVAMDE